MRAPATATGTEVAEHAETIQILYLVPALRTHIAEFSHSSPH